MKTVIAQFGAKLAQYDEVAASSVYVPLDIDLVVPNDGREYVRLKHWDELGSELGFGDNDDPWPEMFTPGCGLKLRDPNGRQYEYVELTDEWLWFLWYWWDFTSQYKLPKGKIESFYTRPGNERTFAKTTPGSLTYVYVDMLEAHRAFTEAGSPEGGFRDPVTNRNMNHPGNVQWLFDPTCGALGRVKQELGTYLELEALDVLLPPPTVESVFARPWLYFWCTQFGKFIGSTRFPQIKNANAVHGLPPQGIPSPLLSIGGSIKVLRTSCVPLVPGQAWSPYKPK